MLSVSLSLTILLTGTDNKIYSVQVSVMNSFIYYF